MNLDFDVQCPCAVGQRIKTPHRLILGRKVIPGGWEGTVIGRIKNGPGWIILVVLWDATGETDRVKLEEIEMLPNAA